MNDMPTQPTLITPGRQAFPITTVHTVTVVLDIEDFEAEQVMSNIDTIHGTESHRVSAGSEEWTISASNVPALDHAVTTLEAGNLLN